MFARKWLILGAGLLATLFGGLTIASSQAASQITVNLTLSSAFVPANGTSTITVTANVRAGNTSQSFRQIRWGITGSGHFASPPPTDTGLFDSAQATFVAGSTPGRPQITVIDTQSSVVGTATINQYGTATGLAISLSQPQVVADGKSSVVATMTATDSAGVGVPVDSIGLAARSSGAGRVTIGAVANNHDGTYSATVTAGTVADMETLTATDSTPATALTATTTLAEIPGPPSDIAWVTAPTAITADGASTTTGKVSVTDAFGNARGADTVVFHSDGHVAIDPATPATDGTYTTTFHASTVSGVEHITATDAGATSPAVALTVNPGPAAGIAFSVAAPTISTTANPPASTVARAMITDAHGNPVPGEHVAITGQGPAHLGAVSDNHDGTYTVTVTASSTPGITVLTAADPSVAYPAGGAQTGPVTRTASVTSLGPPAAVHLGLAPSHIHMGVNNSTIATANVQDSAGDNLPGVTVTFGNDTGDVNFSNSGTGTTDATGSAHVQVNGAAYAGPQKVFASAGNIATMAVLTEYDHPTAMHVTVSPSTITADANVGTAATAVVTITDAGGNGVPGQTFTMTRTGNGTLFPAVDEGDGTYRAVVVSSKTAQTETVNVNDASAALTATTTFIEVAGPAATVTVSPNPASMTADGAATQVLTATVRDVNGNPVGGEHVGFTTSGHATFGSVTAGAAPGTYTATAHASTIAGTETVTATDSTPAQPISGTAPLKLVPGAPTHLAVTPGAVSLVADGHSTTAVGVRIEDAHANGVYGEHLTVGDALAQGATGTADLGSAVVDNGDGTYTVTFTASKTADTETITVADGSLSGSVLVTENPGPAALVTVSPASQSISTDQTTGVGFTATVTDANGNRVKSDSIHFAGDGGVTFPAATTVVGDGTYTATATPAATAGVKTITATDASVTSAVVAGQATLTETPGAPASLTLAQSAGRMTADGISTTTLTATVADRNHNGVAGRTLGVTAAVNGGGTPGIRSAVTDNHDGTYTVTLTSGTRADIETVTVTDGVAGGGTTATPSTTASATITQVAGPAAGVAVALTANSTVTANGSDQRTVTVTVTDANGNPVSGEPVGLFASGAATFASTTLTTATDGTASTLVTASKTAGKETITATDGNIHVQGSATLTENAGPAASISVSVPNSNLTDDGKSTVAVSALVRDANGNPVPGALVTFSVGGNLVTLNPAAAAADASGTASTTVRARTTTGTETVTATTGAVSGTVTLTLVDQDRTAGFVKAAYQTLLGRNVDANGLAHWSNAIRGGMSRPQFAATITSSNEYRSNLVSRMYRPYLHRGSDSGGVAYWTGQIANGATIEQVRLSFIGSPEYFQVHGGTSKGAVDALYQDVLGRSVDAGGEQYWVQQLDSHQLSFSQLAAGILYSEEGREHLVAGIYQDVLGRTAPSGDLAYWAGQLRNGARDETIVNLFVGSAEYFDSIH